MRVTALGQPPFSTTGTEPGVSPTRGSHFENYVPSPSRQNPNLPRGTERNPGFPRHGGYTLKITSPPRPRKTLTSPEGPCTDLLKKPNT